MGSSVDSQSTRPVPSDAGAHGTALDAAYRGDGLRAWKEGAARTYFLYDGINVVCELDADGDLLAASTFGAAGLLSRGSVQYQFDPLGDAVHLLDGDGDVLANRLFDAWGNELTSGTFHPRGYRGRYGYYTDDETGLIALAYRYYVPGVGRFLNRDPIGYEGGVNLFSYCHSGPLDSNDPAGLISTILAALVVGLAGNLGSNLCQALYLHAKCGAPVDVESVVEASMLQTVASVYLGSLIGDDILAILVTVPVNAGISAGVLPVSSTEQERRISALGSTLLSVLIPLALPRLGQVALAAMLSLAVAAFVGGCLWGLAWAQSVVNVEGCRCGTVRS